MRTRAYRRNEREKHIKRKENIIKSYAQNSIPYYYNASDRFNGIQHFYSPPSENSWQSYWYVKHRGYLNKQKIYCSCPFCIKKTRNKGHGRYKHKRTYPNYYPALNYKFSDKKKIESMKDKELLYNTNDDETKLFDIYSDDIECEVSKEELLELISLISN